MTAVYSNSANILLNSDNTLREYQLEVITFDGISEMVYVEARNETEAMYEAVRLIPDADYVMVQGCQG